MATLGNEIEGDLTVGRNVTAGGNATVRGSMTVDHNLEVKGWVKLPNVAGPDKGMYRTLQALMAAWPSPQDGWHALVGTGLPAAVYIGEGGVWRANGQTAGLPEVELPDADNITTRLNDLEEKVGAPGGLATLNGGGKLTAEQLPETVRDVLYFSGIDEERTVSVAEAEEITGSLGVRYSLKSRCFAEEVSLRSGGTVLDYSRVQPLYQQLRIPYEGKIYVDTRTDKLYYWSQGDSSLHEAAGTGGAGTGSAAGSCELLEFDFYGSNMAIMNRVEEDKIGTVYFDTSLRQFWVKNEREYPNCLELYRDYMTTTGSGSLEPREDCIFHCGRQLYRWNGGRFEMERYVTTQDIISLTSMQTDVNNLKTGMGDIGKRMTELEEYVVDMPTGGMQEIELELTEDESGEGWRVGGVAALTTLRSLLLAGAKVAVYALLPLSAGFSTAKARVAAKYSMEVAQGWLYAFEVFDMLYMVTLNRTMPSVSTAEVAPSGIVELMSDLERRLEALEAARQQ